MNITEKNQDPLQNQQFRDTTSYGSQTEGLFNLMGKSEKEVEAELGKPVRVDLSSYGYDWWIYKESEKEYVQVGIEDHEVVTLFAIGEDVNIRPFYIGQSVGKIYATHPIETVVSLDYQGESYYFELSEEDINNRPLIQIGDIYVQLYIDKFTGTLSSIRLMDVPTLIKLYPFDDKGESQEASAVGGINEEKLERDHEKQIFDLTNILRARFQVKPLEWDEEKAKVAYTHSVDKFENDASQTAKKYDEITNTIEEGDVVYQLAVENASYDDIDAPAIVEGWINSNSHRESLLNDDFTHIGIGVYKTYFTRIYFTNRNNE
ncbi:CAP domain-containing protein [Bacillus sp. V3B]|uniref:CAP domain-containing protein n=1 Tax=Bacillus sp. V3B TaxID=2804915 RepID=UPI002108A989|nr:CAP-associated domain-containing protein [Bacillus sp. V3B]MCQ6275142.1 CAP domain-containing protein [Bacillus sp. V3B]